MSASSFARDVRMKGFRDRKSVSEALALLTARLAPLPPEGVHIAAAVDRVLAEGASARVPVPHFRRAAMDGFAVVASSTAAASPDSPARLRVIGEVRAGASASLRVVPGEAVRITTGAPVPEGADAVVMAEHADEDASGTVHVRAPVPAGKHVGAIGEDVPEGALVAASGRRLRPQDVGVLASTGVADVAVIRQPRARILLTGDELLPPGAVPSGSRIVDTNSLVLRALVARDGGVHTVVEYVPDDREATRRAFEHATEDVILVSGGSSVGPEDHAPLVLAELGELAVHGVAMRPSSPTGFGFLPRDGRAVPVFLLPGNPVSCLCAYEFFAGPALRALGGRSLAWPHRVKRCTAAAPFPSVAGRTDYTRVLVDGDRATPLMTSGASILSSTTRADGVVIVPHDRASLAEGEPLDVLLYDA